MHEKQLDNSTRLRLAINTMLRDVNDALINRLLTHYSISQTGICMWCVELIISNPSQAVHWSFLPYKLRVLQPVLRPAVRSGRPSP